MFGSFTRRAQRRLNTTLGAMPMLNAHLGWWQSNFWLGTASVVADVVIVSLFLLSKSFRNRFARADIDLEAIGLAVLVLAITITGLYNYFWR